MPSVAGITVVTALAAMIIEASLICYIAFGLPLILAPWSIVQRRWLNKAPTIRGQINLCREQAARLAQLNLQFGKENDRLQGEAQRLQQVQAQLKMIVERQGGSVQELRGLIKEYGNIQKQIKVRCLFQCACTCAVWTFASLMNLVFCCCTTTGGAKGP